MKFVIALILAVGVSSAKSNLSSISLYGNRTRCIVGGVEATPHEIPSILNPGYHNCGATLIHPQWALTTAHCANIDQLVAGDHIMYKDEGTEQKIRVAQRFLHPKYEYYFHCLNPKYECPGPYSNNAALLKLETPFKLNQYVSVAKLPPRNFQPTGDALLAGWGYTEGGCFPNKLYKLTVPLVSNDACKRVYGSCDYSIICAGIVKLDSCLGDFGGPMFCDSPNGLVHCGIVSFGRGCGLPGYPGVYARTSHLLDWIKETTGLEV